MCHDDEYQESQTRNVGVHEAWLRCGEARRRNASGIRARRDLRAVLQRSREMTRVYSAEVDQTFASDRRVDFHLGSGRPGRLWRTGTLQAGGARRPVKDGRSPPPCGASAASVLDGPSTSPIWCSTTSARNSVFDGRQRHAERRVCCDRLRQANAPARGRRGRWRRRTSFRWCCRHHRRHRGGMGRRF
jgi:hypothetical protein